MLGKVSQHVWRRGNKLEQTLKHQQLFVFLQSMLPDAKVQCEPCKTRGYEVKQYCKLTVIRCRMDYPLRWTAGIDESEWEWISTRSSS